MQRTMRYKGQPPKRSKKRPEAENDGKSGSDCDQSAVLAMWNEPLPRIGENGQNENSSEKAKENEAETDQRGIKNSKKR